MVEFIEDIESDMSVYHRVDDIYAMSPHTFFSRALRLVAYDGALASAVRNRVQPQEARPTAQTVTPSTSDVNPTPAQIEAKRNQMRAAQFGAMRNGDGTPVWDGQVEYVSPDELHKLGVT